MFVFNKNDHKSGLRDKFILKLHFFVAKYLCIYPFTFVNERCSIGKVYAAVILVSLVSMSFYKGYKNLTDKKLTAFGAIIMASFTFTQGALYISLLFNNMMKINYWKYLMMDLSNFDHSCGSYQVCIDQKKRKIIIFISSRLLVVSYAIFEYVIWPRNKTLSYIPQFLPKHIAFLYDISLATMIWELSAVIQSRYEFLQNDLGKILEQGPLTQDRFDKEIMEMKKLYKILHRIVKGVDQIFGKVILMFLANLQVTILYGVYWTVLFWDIHLNYQIIICSFLNWALVVVSKS